MRAQDPPRPGRGAHEHESAVEQATELRDVAVEIARRAGAYIASRAHEHLQADSKTSATDAVTEVDRASEALIVSLLDEMRPGDGIVGEEGANRPSSTGVRWIVDPLDGTVNFLYGIGAYAVSIAAEVGGRVVAGAVFDVPRGFMYDGVLGAGSRRDGAPLACSRVGELGMALVGTGFGYEAHIRAQQGALAARVLPQVRDLRRIGSAALDLCLVAAGGLDGFYESGLHEWDRAAALLIAEEAGARWIVIPEEGERDLTVAAPPGVFDALLAACT